MKHKYNHYVIHPYVHDYDDGDYYYNDVVQLILLYSQHIIDYHIVLIKLEDDNEVL